MSSFNVFCTDLFMQVHSFGFPKALSYYFLLPTLLDCNSFRSYSILNPFSIKQSAPVGVKVGCKKFFVSAFKKNTSCGQLKYDDDEFSQWKMTFSIVLKTFRTASAASSVFQLSVLGVCVCV